MLSILSLLHGYVVFPVQAVFIVYAVFAVHPVFAVYILSKQAWLCFKQYTYS